MGLRLLWQPAIAVIVTHDDCLVVFWQINSLSLYTVCLKKTIHLTFGHNFGKCRPIFKFLSLTDFQENSLCNCCTVLLHDLANFKNLKWQLNFYIPLKLISFTWNITKVNNI